MLKNKKAVSVTVVMLVLLMVAGLAVKKIRSPLGDSPLKTGKAPVETAMVKIGSISARLVYSGTVVSNNDAVISSKIVGRITSLPVKEGDVVSRGDLLCIIDDSEYTGKIDTLRQRLNTSQLNFKYLAEQMAKYDQLYQARAISEQAYLQYKLQRDVAASQLEEARFSLRELEIALENAHIKAPFGGIVTSLQSQPGDMAVVGKPILVLSDTNKLKALVQVTESDLAVVRESAGVQLTSPLLPGVIEARVEKVYPSADPKTRTTIVEIPITGAALSPGASIDVAFLTGSREKALVAPAGSVMEDNSGSYVYLVSNGKAVKRKVITGIKSDSEVEITGGLAQGDEIVVSNTAALTDGKELYVFKRGGGAQ